MTTEQEPLLTQPGFIAETDENPPDPLPQLLRNVGDALCALGHYLCHNTTRWREYLIFLLFECVTGMALFLTGLMALLGRAVFAASDVVLGAFNVTRNSAGRPGESCHDSLYGVGMGQVWMSLLLLLACYVIAAVYRRFVPYVQADLSV